jgi:hypothetical protein
MHGQQNIIFMILKYQTRNVRCLRYAWTADMCTLQLKVGTKASYCGYLCYHKLLRLPSLSQITAVTFVITNYCGYLCYHKLLRLHLLSQITAVTFVITNYCGYICYHKLLRLPSLSQITAVAFVITNSLPGFMKMCGMAY